MKMEKSSSKGKKKLPNSEIRKKFGVWKSCEGQDFQRLEPRPDDDPMRLVRDAMKRLDNYFLTRNITYVSGQRQFMESAIQAILQGEQGIITAIPFAPGLGKSTMIRALLSVLAGEFQTDTPIAKRVGGVILVVEKTSEAYEYKNLLNPTAASDLPIAFVLEGPNDFNLGTGHCANGTATSYAECRRRACPDYRQCPLMQSMSRTRETPVLIMLHARYQNYLDDMSPFTTWDGPDSKERLRTLLLIDEEPRLIDEAVIDISTLNEIETSLSNARPSYQPATQRQKNTLLYAWNKAMRTPYFKLLTIIRKRSSFYGLISPQELVSAGFLPDELQALRIIAIDYLQAKRHPAIAMIDAILSGKPVYYAVGQNISLFLPRLVQFDTASPISTFLFSGTAEMSSEISCNPNIKMLQGKADESFQRLQVCVQHADIFNVSRTALQNNGNLFCVAVWLKCTLSDLVQRHRKVLVATYKSQARFLWEQLRDFHESLIPYIDGNDQQQPMLPYFGGLNGSNQYQEATCVVCLGLNRYEPRQYISNALALDYDDKNTAQLLAFEAEQTTLRLDQVPCVLDAQDASLVTDIVQLVFRSALRRHGESRPIELWLLQPPNGVVARIKEYFGDCQVKEISDVPEPCRHARVLGKQRKGQRTGAAILLEWLQHWDGAEPVTPNQIRAETGLTQSQFKEAKKNPEVQDFFRAHVQKHGSGKNAVYSLAGVARNCLDSKEHGLESGLTA